jgi:TM2 domain-containing membrane protein YozV
MSVSSYSPPRCVSCSKILAQPVQVCPACGAHQDQPQQSQIVTYVTRTQKSVGLAVFLSFLWLGAGHLYAGKVGTGMVLAFADLVLVLIAFTGIGLFVSVPIWLIAVPLVMVWAASTTQSRNQLQPARIQ